MTYGLSGERAAQLLGKGCDYIAGDPLSSFGIIGVRQRAYEPIPTLNFTLMPYRAEDVVAQLDGFMAVDRTLSYLTLVKFPTSAVPQPMYWLRAGMLPATSAHCRG